MNLVINRSYLYKVVTVILSVILLTGCTGEKVIEEAIGKEEPLKGNINVWCSKEVEESIKYSAALFSEKNPDVTIKITVTSGVDLDKRLSQGLSENKELPDILEVDTAIIPSVVNKYPEIFRTVDEDIAEIKNKMLDWKLKEVTIGDDIYGFPWDTNPKVMLYNKTLAEKYNIDPFTIKTWNQFLQIGDRLKTESAGKTKLLALGEGYNGELYSSMLRQLRLPLYSRNGAIELPEKENRVVLTNISQMYNQQLIYDLKSGEDPIEVVRHENALAMIADGSIINKINNSTELNKNKWQIERLPSFEYGGKTSASGEGNALMLTKINADSELSASFIRFMLTDNESIIYALNNAGIIPSITEAYSLPVFNGITDNFNGLKVWRFMAEQGKEEVELIYDKDYSNAALELRKLEQAAIAGQDLGVVIELYEQELNKKIK